jgi:hypothetical protein
MRCSDDEEEDTICLFKELFGHSSGGTEKSCEDFGMFGEHWHFV